MTKPGSNKLPFTPDPTELEVPFLPSSSLAKRSLDSERKNNSGNFKPVINRYLNEGEESGTLEVAALSKKWNNGVMEFSEISAIESQVHQEDIAEREKIDKFTRKSFGGKPPKKNGEYVKVKLPKARSAWKECPVGGLMTEMEKEINAEYHRSNDD